MFCMFGHYSGGGEEANVRLVEGEALLKLQLVDCEIFI